MQREVAAIVLGLLVQGAMAQCVAPAATNAHPAAAVEPVHAATAATAQAPANTRPAPELIKTAAAGTREDAPPSMRESTRNANGQDHPRRGGTAMLLAALALMSGIALRRYGASDK